MKPTLLLLALTCLPTLSTAQDKPVPATATPTLIAQSKAQVFRLPEGKVGIQDLIDGAARFLGRNILTNPVELMSAGQDSGFTLQKAIETDAKGCEELLYNLLYTKGYAVVPIDPQKGVYEVVAMAGPRGREVFNRPARRSIAEVLARPDFKECVLVTMPLKNINATVATAALRPFFASAGPAGGSLTIGNVGNNTSILIEGYGDQVANAIQLLQECDKAVPVPAEQLSPATDRIAALETAVAQLQAQVQALKRN